jgi:hypothetical protein
LLRFAIHLGDGISFGIIKMPNDSMVKLKNLLETIKYYFQKKGLQGKGQASLDTWPFQLSKFGMMTIESKSGIAILPVPGGSSSWVFQYQLLPVH